MIFGDEVGGVIDIVYYQWWDPSLPAYDMYASLHAVCREVAILTVVKPFRNQN